MNYNLADELRIIMKEEGDGEDFFHAGLPCSVWRSQNGAWAGYVGVGFGHFLHGNRAAWGMFGVHGGVTYTGERPMRGQIWWIGFDCWHLHDIIPERIFEGGEPEDMFSGYRSKRYVMNETRSLARQIAEFEE